jgi:hypothetical protein
MTNDQIINLKIRLTSENGQNSKQKTNYLMTNDQIINLKVRLTSENGQNSKQKTN